MMKNAFGSMLLREWRIKRQGAVQWLFPLMIFLIIITLFPLAVGSESALLLRLATSAVWIAALLSLVMGVDDLFKADMENGTLAQLVVSGSPLSVWVFARLLVHWLFSAGFVAVLSLLANPLFNMPFDETLMLMLSIIVGSPLMLMLSAIASSLVLSLKNGAVLVPLIALPMQLPVLIFATGAVDLYATGLNGLPTLALLGAMSIIAVIVTPWVVAQILKMAWSS
ncbi:ABC transporter permease [Moraxella bovoculi]|uniref:Heme exporter protein B n=1 Tax=Moraxella bovoculi TaxID=386891 RepID=A0AAC8PWC3_9GAMM|nr:heme exporter protein CcmB [Moraxella bovoculi]AKG08175.1 ABC transporter permease [Moraxella bovoculi]AKG09269.1 ABC transporter permease [Moraxella bovoculi]AKG11103.1 ABC transporter permease [Moraxella bovoculi]AKG13095.1 ABC transporter permease [Moraxella bovoculi]